VKNERQILEIRARFLSDLLEGSSGISTIDAVTTEEEITSKFPDGGYWRGCVVTTLSRREIICRLTATPSMRKARKGGLVGVWKLEDATAALAELVRIKRRLAELDATDAPPPGTPPKPRQRRLDLGGGAGDE